MNMNKADMQAKKHHSIYIQEHLPMSLICLTKPVKKAKYTNKPSFDLRTEASDS